MPLETTRPGAVHLKNPDGLYDPEPNGYSHVAEIQGSARLVFFSGQGGQDKTGALPSDFRAQMKQAFANVLIALKSGGAAPRDVVKLTVLIVDHTERRLSVFGEELDAAFGGVKPACTLIPTPRLALDGMLVEIEATIALSA